MLKQLLLMTVYLIVLCGCTSNSHIDDKFDLSLDGVIPAIDVIMVDVAVPEMVVVKDEVLTSNLLGGLPYLNPERVLPLPNKYGSKTGDWWRYGFSTGLMSYEELQELHHTILRIIGVRQSWIPIDGVVSENVIFQIVE